MGIAEPWERPCGICNGSGQVMSLAWAAWHEEYEHLERISDLPSRLRALAEHVRRVPTEVEVLRCPECRGDGVVVTEQGQAVLDFLERRLRPRPESGNPLPRREEPSTWHQEPPLDDETTSVFVRPRRPPGAPGHAKEDLPEPWLLQARPPWRSAEADQ